VVHLADIWPGKFARDLRQEASSSASDLVSSSATAGNPACPAIVRAVPYAEIHVEFARNQSSELQQVVIRAPLSKDLG
jgi:hypothetical protein